MVSERVARVLQERSPELAQTRPELLAHHLTEAGLASEAAGFWARAGERAHRRSALAEATAHFTKALKVLDTLPPAPGRDLDELRILTAAGIPLTAARGYAAPEVRRLNARIRELCSTVKDPAVVHGALGGLWTSVVSYDLPEALALAERLCVSAVHSNDAAAMVWSHTFMASALYFSGRFEQALEHCERCVAHYDPDLHRPQVVWLTQHDPGVHCLAEGARALWILGFPSRALDRVEATRALVRRVAHPLTTVIALLREVDVRLACGQNSLAEQLLREASAIAVERGIDYFATSFRYLLGWFRVEQGEAEAGLEQMRALLPALRAAGGDVFGIPRLFYLGLACEKCGRGEEALALLSEALEAVVRTGARAFEAEIHRSRGELLLRLPFPNEADAEAALVRALEVASDQQARSLELRAAMSLARLWKSQSRRSDAGALLARVYDWFTEGFDTADLRAARALLDELGLEGGRRPVGT